MHGDHSNVIQQPVCEEVGRSIASFSEAVKFHGHTCPGLAMGYRAAGIAIRELRAGRDVDEELVTVVENDACGLDAIQVVTGCTIGKGNLIFRDYGKHAYTFINRATGDAVRVCTKEIKNLQDDETSKLRAKVMSGKATEKETKKFRAAMEKIVADMLEGPADKYFEVKHVKAEIPGKARIFNSVKCSKCGEMTAESRARVRNGQFVCIPCNEEYTRGW